MRERFEAQGIDASRVVAEMLLAHVLQCDRMRLYMDVDREATDAERDTLRTLVRRALQHEPVQYLVGKAWFYAMEFEVSNATLIPQPCTEDLVARALTWLPSREKRGDAVMHAMDRAVAEVTGDALPVLDLDGVDTASDQPANTGPTTAAPRVLDVGTGSGAIAVALAKHTTDAVTFVATDLVADATALAERNAHAHGVASRIDTRTGSLYAPVAGEQFDVIVSNPPYIPDGEWTGGDVERAVREHVPESALRGGPDGLEFVRPLLMHARDSLRPGGRIIVEIAASTAAAAADVARDAGLQDVEIVTDSEGFERFVEQNLETETSTLLTVPLIGWIPKAGDESCAFSVSKYGAQQDE